MRYSPISQNATDSARRISTPTKQMSGEVPALCDGIQGPRDRERHCDGEISLKRLTVLPFALRCRECEALHEIGEGRSRQFSAGHSYSLPRLDTDGRD